MRKGANGNEARDQVTGERETGTPGSGGAAPGQAGDASLSYRAMVLSTEWAQVEVVDLVNDGNGLGFNIVGGKSTGVVIKYVVPGSAADKDGRLLPGDHVLQVGAVNLRGFTSDQVASVLRQSGDGVRILVARPVDPSSADLAAVPARAPIVPTKLISDPELLDHHLIQNGYTDIYDAIPQCYEEKPDREEMEIEPRFVYPMAAFVDVVGKNPVCIGEPKVLTSPVIAVTTVSVPAEIVPKLPSPPEMEVVTVVLNKNVYGLGVTVAGYVCEKEELSGIFVKSIIEGSAAELSGKIKINDRIVDVDGESLIGKTNHQAVEILRNTDISVTLVLERYLRGPKFEHLQSALWREDSPPSPPSPSVTTLSWFQVQTDNAESTIDAEPESHTTIDSTILEPDDMEDPCPEIIDKELDAHLDVTSYKDKWSEKVGNDKDIIVADISKLSGLGISLEGTVDVEGGQELRPHHYIRSVLPQGPVGLHGALQAGDELLQVNEHCLHGLKHTEVVSILKELPSKVRLVCARSSIDMGPRPIINISQDREGFETRKIISGSFHNITSMIKSHSDGSINTSSTATLTDHSVSKKSHSLECVSNLAMWNDDEVFIELPKGEQGLGFSILDYQDPIDPEGTVIVVRSLVPGGVAEKHGKVSPGDRLLSVNGTSIKNVTLDQAVHALKSAPLGIVRLGLSKPLPLAENCSKSIRSSISGSLPTKVSS